MVDMGSFLRLRGQASAFGAMLRHRERKLNTRNALAA